MWFSGVITTIHPQKFRSTQRMRCSNRLSQILTTFMHCPHRAIVRDFYSYVTVTHTYHCSAYSTRQKRSELEDPTPSATITIPPGTPPNLNSVSHMIRQRQKVTLKPTNLTFHIHRAPCWLSRLSPVLWFNRRAVKGFTTRLTPTVWKLNIDVWCRLT